MKTPISYIFKINLPRKQFKKDDNISEEIIFEDNNPIIARIKAINKVNSYLDVIFNKEFDNYDYRKLGEEIHTRAKYGNEDLDKIPFKLKYKEYGLGVFLKFNEDYKEYKKGDEIMIFGNGFGNDLIDIVYNLEIEYEIYKKNNFKTNNLERKIKFYDDGELEDFFILNTPYKWDNIIEESISYYLEDLKQETEKEDEKKIKEKHNETTLVF